MTRIQYEHHAEQMEAYRAEFAEYWKYLTNPPPAKMSQQELAMMELSFWNEWYSEKKSGAR